VSGNERSGRKNVLDEKSKTIFLINTLKSTRFYALDIYLECGKIGIPMMREKRVNFKKPIIFTAPFGANFFCRLSLGGKKI
jgi:hypothetical protein